MQLRGVRPFFSDKFDITKHPNYRYLSDADPKNAFDMEKHINEEAAAGKKNLEALDKSFERRVFEVLPAGGMEGFCRCIGKKFMGICLSIIFVKH